MRNKILPLIGALIAGGAVIAQTPPAGPPVGLASKVQGLVTVSIGTTVDSLTNNKPIFDGSRVVTSSTGSLSLNFKDGCVVDMTPNQSVIVNSSESCPDRDKAVVALGLPGGGTGPIGSLVPGLLTNIAGAALVSTGITTLAPVVGGGSQLPDISSQ